ncbi:3-oxoacyl-(acyl-carrier-protein) synthase [Catenulispora sp. GAS73]
MLDLIRGAAREGRWDAALVNSFGFGGHNVMVAFTQV